MDTLAGIPQIDGYTDALISKTNDFADYLKDISQRAENVRKGYVSRKDDNMLKITTDGRKAALDLRLVDPSAMFTYQSKVARCVENVADIYFKTTACKSAQIIFCDTSTPKTGFNIYDEVKTMLQSKGVPSDKIAFIHDARTEAQRNTMFAQVRKGDIRVLLGSTFKLGLGVNIQDKLIALHHIDVPWRPADMTQREGAFCAKEIPIQKCRFSDISQKGALMPIHGSCSKPSNDLLPDCFPDRLPSGVERILKTQCSTMPRSKLWP